MTDTEVPNLIPSPTQNDYPGDDQDQDQDQDQDDAELTEAEKKIKEDQRNSTSPDDGYYTEEKYKLENNVIWFLRILTWLIILASLAAIITGAAGFSIPKIIPSVGILNPAQALAVFGAITFTAIGVIYLYLEFGAKELVKRWRGFSAGERIAAAITIIIGVAAFLIANIPLISEAVSLQDGPTWLVPLLTYFSIGLIVLTLAIHIWRMWYTGSMLDSVSSVSFTNEEFKKEQATSVAQFNAMNREYDPNNDPAFKVTHVIADSMTASSTTAPEPLTEDQLPSTVPGTVNTENKTVYHSSFREQ